ncbi:hypothetical protein SOCEGT47_046550 [Sorangium cellulosum]|uniref:Uncharacterized protein n=1 Tax=Sorangium cellulosum TaxID=56 RepID=A0A4P2Q475_SORCE|nr:hypothetical protein [Sorangium cellulosum]AUX24119.1 hypothetical protein SOCEGT47_046550 [Sorangium cellulosum]
MRPFHIAPLQPLRIPTGWRITINNLCEFNPCTINDPSDERWEYLEEDLFSAQHEHYQTTVDVGWYPSMSPDGNYKAIFILNDDWNNPLDELVTRNLQEIVPWLEERMANPQARRKGRTQ